MFATHLKSIANEFRALASITNNVTLYLATQGGMCTVGNRGITLLGKEKSLRSQENKRFFSCYGFTN